MKNHRQWPSRASLEAIRKSNIDSKDIDAIILATTTPDAAMPSTACILQDRLCLPVIPAFDINAACSGWLYAVAMARGMILSGMARNVLTGRRRYAIAAIGAIGPQRVFYFWRRCGRGDNFQRPARASDSRGDFRRGLGGNSHGPSRTTRLMRLATASRSSIPGFASTGKPYSVLPPRVLPL